MAASPIQYGGVREAILNARRRAAETATPQTVWRCGDRYKFAPESDGAPEFSESLPVRPVATYDPDGTEHA